MNLSRSSPGANLWRENLSHRGMGYGYIWSEEDMGLLNVYEQAIAATDQDLGDDQLAALIAQAGLTNEHMLWLVCLHELRPHLEARIAQRPPTVDRPYQPFDELLKGLEQSIETNIAIGVLSSDDAELIHLPELARTNPLWLVEAEHIWDSFNADLSDLDQESEVAAGERTAGSPRRCMDLGQLISLSFTGTILSRSTTSRG